MLVTRQRESFSKQIALLEARLAGMPFGPREHHERAILLGLLLQRLPHEVLQWPLLRYSTRYIHLIPWTRPTSPAYRNNNQLAALTPGFQLIDGSVHHL